MSIAQKKLARTRLSALELAEELRIVSEACRRQQAKGPGYLSNTIRLVCEKLPASNR